MTMATIPRMCALILVLASASFAQNETPPRHYLIFFVSAEEYKDSPIAERSAYLMGWLDGRMNGRLGTAKGIKAMRDCAEGKTITQITAIVDKYVQGHPETWDRPASLEADAALGDVCPDLRQVMDGQ
ncbi:MAG: hypothetical protein WAN51_09205 [Alphaproteobacteria bacterium]|jgi:hypothetical protein